MCRRAFEMKKKGPSPAGLGVVSAALASTSPTAGIGIA